jgi:hypothetical protein
MEKPQTITNSDLITEYWLARLVKEQAKTNELLERLLVSLASKPKATRKKKEGE